MLTKEYSTITDADSFPINHLFDNITDIQIVQLRGAGSSCQGNTIIDAHTLCLSEVDDLPYKLLYGDTYNLEIYGDVSSKAIPFLKLGILNISIIGKDSTAKVKIQAPYIPIVKLYLSNLQVELIGTLKIDTLQLNTNVKFSNSEVDIKGNILYSVAPVLPDFSVRLRDNAFSFVYITNNAPTTIRIEEFAWIVTVNYVNYIINQHGFSDSLILSVDISYRTSYNLEVSTSSFENFERFKPFSIDFVNPPSDLFLFNVNLNVAGVPSNVELTHDIRLAVEGDNIYLLTTLQNADPSLQTFIVNQYDSVIVEEPQLSPCTLR